MTTLVYIGGLSRSGSTLLEMLLASHDGIVTVGELQILPHELRGGETAIPCGCGSTVSACPFWRGVVRRVDPRTQPGPPLDLFREHHTWGHTLRPGRIADAAERPPEPALRRAMAAYGAATRALIEAVAAESGAETGSPPEIVVDASKDPYRALWLARSGCVDLRLVHLVRDPRGSITSLAGDRTGIGRSVVAARRSGAWLLENELIDRTRRFLAADHSVRVHYEDLATDPVRELGRVLAMVDRDVDPSAPDRYTTTRVHTVAGNPMRRDRRPVRLDERWRTDLAGPARWITDLLTAPGRRRFAS